MDTTIRIIARHLSSDEAIREIRECYGVREFSDACAGTVASWFASSGTVGNVLASLSTGTPVDVESLLTDIHMTRIHTSGLMPHDREGLDLLATWAIRKVNDDNWREATAEETEAWLSGYISGDRYRETEHGLEVRD